VVYTYHPYILMPTHSSGGLMLNLFH